VTSYARAAARGRDTAHETNTRFKLVTIVAHQRERVGEGLGWNRDTFTGSCGHTLDAKYRMTFEFAQKEVGRRRRCPQCSADPPKPIPVDHCTYGIAGERGERDCPTRAWYDDPAYGLLCRKHHDHLLREGYIEQPAPRYQRPPGPVQYKEPPAPAMPELSPPLRGHLRLVR